MNDNHVLQIEKKEIFCPICKLKLPQSSRGKTLHAQSHKISPQELYALIINGWPRCACLNCHGTDGTNVGKKTQWKGWGKGFSQYTKGHMSSDSRKLGVEKLKIFLNENHWSKGKTIETDFRIANASFKISSTLKNKFEKGLITHWATGKTSKTDTRIATASEKRSISLKSSNHWNFTTTSDVINKIMLSLGDRFKIISGLTNVDLENRFNNREYKLNIKCLLCNGNFEKSIYDIIRYEQKKCICSYNNVSSIQQKEIEEFIKSLNVNYKSSDRTNLTGFELDIFIIDKNLAIEYNGLYWHSNAIQHDKHYHEKKTIACRQLGINLFHIFQDEWELKQDIIKSMIKNRLGLSSSVYARQCKISILSPSVASTFFKENHLDGDTKGFITYCLRVNNDIVSAIKIRKPHSSKWKGYIEIARFVSKQCINVIGGHSRLISHISKNHNEKIVSYVDTRFGGEGKHCEMSNMKLDHITGIGFWWTDRIKRFNRLYCKANKEKTELELSKEMKLLKIWGCSNLVYVKE